MRSLWWLTPLALGIGLSMWINSLPPIFPACIEIPLITGDDACP